MALWTAIANIVRLLLEWWAGERIARSTPEAKKQTAHNEAAKRIVTGDERAVNRALDERLRALRGDTGEPRSKESDGGKTVPK